jgi:hypothetical protein
MIKNMLKRRKESDVNSMREPSGRTISFRQNSKKAIEIIWKPPSNGR